MQAVLLNHGANASQRADAGVTALHLSFRNGQLTVAVAPVLVGADAGARLVSDGATPLHMTAGHGHSGVTRALIDQGAKVGCRLMDGSTPLNLAALRRHLNAVLQVLRVKANLTISLKEQSSGTKVVPLEAAASCGYSEMIRELIQQLEVTRCGGETGGVGAFIVVATNQHLHIMAMLTDAGGSSRSQRRGIRLACAVYFLL